jgi:hypothetical protein
MTHRWRAVAIYRSNNGPVCVEWKFEELDELRKLVERGPDWNALIEIRVTLARRTRTGLTVEAANRVEDWSRPT